MNSNASLIPLGEIVSIKGGKRLPKGAALQSIKNSHPYIRVRDMGQRYIPSDGLEYVPDEVFPKIQRYIVHENDVIISIVGTIGLVSVIDSKFHLASQTENAAKLTGLDSIDAHYLYYYLNSHIGQSEIRQRTVGAVQPKLPLYNIETIPIIWPGRPSRTEVVKQLMALDRKIQLNQQINQTLEQMAQAIFKSWFVDFEPVKAKIAALEAGGSEDDALLAAMQVISGKDPQQLTQLQTENPEHYTSLRATAELFPAAMQESELGEIPEGWEVKRIGNYLDTISKTYPLKKVKEVIFLNTGDIKEGRFLHANKSLSEGLPGQAKKSIQKNDILYSEIRPQNKRFAYVYFDADDYVVSTKLMVLRSSGKIDSQFLYFVLTQKNSIDYLQMMAESRSGTFPQITFDVLEKINFFGPNNNQLLNVFSEMFLLPFMKKDHEIDIQNKNLEGLRDTLLPKLLSGELSVNQDVD